MGNRLPLTRDAGIILWVFYTTMNVIKFQIQRVVSDGKANKPQPYILCIPSVIVCLLQLFGWTRTSNSSSSSILIKQEIGEQLHHYIQSRTLFHRIKHSWFKKMFYPHCCHPLHLPFFVLPLIFNLKQVFLLLTLK